MIIEGDESSNTDKYIEKIVNLLKFADVYSAQNQKNLNKVIELYKENEHGTELVKDIERVLALQSKDDEYTPSPRAKEYLKRCIALIKEK